jgi:hypothetical protein
MESEVPKETPLKKIYFNIYVAGVKDMILKQLIVIYFILHY